MILELDKLNWIICSSCFLVVVVVVVVGFQFFFIILSYEINIIFTNYKSQFRPNP